MPFGQFTFGWPARAKHGKAGRERNSGRSLNSSTTYQTCGKVGCGTKRRNKSIHFRSSYIIARIPLQSEKRFRRAVFLTASPREKRFGANSNIFRTFCLRPHGTWIPMRFFTAPFLLNAQGNPDGSPAHTPSFRFRHGSGGYNCKRRASFRSPFRVM